jgi:mRNA interferase MazF
MPCSRGDVVLVWFPDSNLQTQKRRPALVVQADHLATGLPQVVVCMITSNLARRGHASRVFVASSSSEGQAMSLTADSVIMTDNLATVLESAIYRVIGKLSDMTAVDAGLRITLGL